MLQLGRDSPTDKQILGKIKLFYPHEDSSLIPSSCAVLGDTEDIQESSLEKTASFESLIEQLRKIEKRTPYEEDRFQRLQHADDHMKLFGSDIKEAVYFSAIDKDNFKEQRKILNGNTQRRTVAGKSKKLALNMQQRCYHMEKRLLILIHIHKQSNFLPLRKHALIFRLCVHELDGSVCEMCKKTPHKIPPEVVKDLPKRSQGGLFWDITLDPNLPGSLPNC